MTDAAPAPRSTFVTVLAWFGIVLGVFGVLGSLLQWLIMAYTMPMSVDELLADPSMAAMPSTIRWMFAHYRLLMAANLVAVGVMLGGSIGLLMRRNWGRLAIIALLALGIASNVAGLGLQFAILDQVSRIDPGPQAHADFEREFATVRVFVLGFSALFALGFAALYAWLIRKLASAPVRREFGVG